MVKKYEICFEAYLSHSSHRLWRERHAGRNGFCLAPACVCVCTRIASISPGFDPPSFILWNKLTAETKTCTHSVDSWGYTLCLPFHFCGEDWRPCVCRAHTLGRERGRLYTYLINFIGSNIVRRWRSVHRRSCFASTPLCAPHSCRLTAGSRWWWCIWQRGASIDDLIAK